MTQFANHAQHATRPAPRRLNSLWGGAPLGRGALLGGAGLLAVALSGCSAQQSQPESLAAGAACSDLNENASAKLYEPGKMVNAKPIEERVFKARAIQPVMTFGATMFVRAEEGLSAPYVHRVLSCHAAGRQAGHPNDPLHPTSGEVTDIAVNDANGWYAVHVRADDPKVGKEIWQRADALTTQGGSVDVKQVGLQERRQRNL